MWFMISAKRINTLQEVAALQLNHWCLAAVGVAFIELWNHLNGFYIPFPFLMWLAAGIIPIYLQVIRKKVSQVFLVVVTHLAALVTIPVASFLWPETYALYGFLVVAYMVFSLYYKLSAEKDVMPLFPLMGVGISLLLPVVMLLLLKRQAAIDLIIVGTVFLAGFYLLCFYISNLNRYYTLSKDTVDGMPFARILGSGFKRVSVYAGIIMLLSFAVSRFQALEEISKFIIDMIIMVIRIVVRAIFAWLAKQKYDYGAEDVVEIIKPEEMPEASMLGRLLGGIVSFILLLVCMYIAYLAIRGFIMFLRSRVGSRHVVQECDGVVEVREHCEIRSERRSLFDILKGRTTEEKMRRLYKKTAIANKDKIFGSVREKEALMYYTSQEAARKMEREPMNELYDKARYSDQKCTAGDLKEMKQLASQTE